MSVELFERALRMLRAEDLRPFPRDMWPRRFRWRVSEDVYAALAGWIRHSGWADTSREGVDSGLADYLYGYPLERDAGLGLDVIVLDELS